MGLHELCQIASGYADLFGKLGDSDLFTKMHLHITGCVLVVGQLIPVVLGDIVFFAGGFFNHMGQDRAQKTGAHQTVVHAEFEVAEHVLDQVFNQFRVI